MDEAKVRLTFEKGILESQEDSVLDPGFLASCENWVPEPTGALRTRIGWKNGSTTSAPSTRNIRGGTRFSVSRPYATPARLRTATANASANSLGLNFGSASTAGSCLIAVIGGKAGSGDVTTFLTPTGWFKVSEQIDNSLTDGFGVAMFYKPNTTATGATFTMAHTGAGPEMVGRLMEYSNLHAVTPLDKSTTNNGITSLATQESPKVDSGTTQPLGQSAGLFVAGFALATAQTWSDITETFTSVAEDAFPTVAEIATFQRVASTGTAAHMKATLDGTTSWVAVTGVFKAKTQTVTSIDKYVVANRNSSTEFQLYSHDRDLTSGAWSSVDTISGLASATEPVSFASGLGQLLYTHPQFSATRSWDGTTAAAITGAPAGRCVAYNRGRFYVASGTKLYFSKLNDPFVWDLDDYEEFGEDDGFDIEDVQAMGDGMLVAKQNSLWFLAGTGPDDFQKEGPLAGGGFRGRSICVTPYGAVVAGEKRIYLYNGSLEEFGKPIQSSYALTGTWLTTGYSDDVVHILDSGTQTIFVFNIKTSAWSLEKLSGSNDGPQTIFSDNERLLYGPKAATTVGPLAYKTFPGDRAVDAGMGSTTQGGLVITPIYNGTDSDKPQTIDVKDAAGVYREKVSIGDDDYKGVDSVQFRFSQAGAESFTASTPEMWRHGPDTAITPHYLYLQLRQRGTGTTATFDIEHVIFSFGLVDRA